MAFREDRSSAGWPTSLRTNQVGDAGRRKSRRRAPRAQGRTSMPDKDVRHGSPENRQNPEPRCRISDQSPAKSENRKLYRTRIQLSDRSLAALPDRRGKPQRGSPGNSGKYPNISKARSTRAAKKGHLGSSAETKFASFGCGIFQSSPTSFNSTVRRSWRDHGNREAEIPAEPRSRQSRESIL